MGAFARSSRLIFLLDVVLKASVIDGMRSLAERVRCYLVSDLLPCFFALLLDLGVARASLLFGGPLSFLFGLYRQKPIDRKRTEANSYEQ